MSRYFLSPSRVARYYFHECDRYLRYTATPKAIQAEEGVPPFELDHSLLTKAVLDSGYVWEEEVLESHIKESRVLAPLMDGQPEPTITSRVHTVEQTIDALKNATAGQFIYQPALIAAPNFYERYGLDRELVGFSQCRPDLLMVTRDDDTGPLQVKVLDLKATDEAKLSHKIQATLYTLILQSVIDDLGLSDITTTRQGGVWLYKKEEPELFDLSGVRPPLEHFLRNELQPILAKPAGEALWHLYFRCEWCDFYKHCRTEAEEKNDVSLVPYLSTFAKRHLAKAANVQTIDDLDDLLKDEKKSEEVLVGSASLRGKRERLSLSIDSIRTGNPHQTGASSVAMPVGENVSVVVTLQSEPLQGSTYGYAIHRFGAGPVKKRPSEPHVFDQWTSVTSRVAPSPADSDIAELRRTFVKEMMSILRPIHDFNAQHSGENEWSIRKSVQVYVFDSYERELLVDLLLHATQDPDIRIAQDALLLFFHFQHPDLAAADDHPANEVFFPVVVLTNVIRSVFALPIKVSYNFCEVVSALQPSQYGFTYERHPHFDFEISNRMKSDAIYKAWFKGATDRIEWVASRLKQRVRATNAVISGVRERLKGSSAVFAWPPKFALQEGAGFQHRLLSRLAFVTRYEAVLQFLDLRTRRAASEAERLASGDTFRLTYVGEGRYRLDPSQAEFDLDTSSFFNWFLTTDTDGGRKARFAYDDFTYRKLPYAPKRLNMALAKVKARAGDLVTLDLNKTAEFVPPNEGDTCFLEARFSDSMTEYLVGEIAALDNETSPWFVSLLANPVQARVAVDQSDSLRRVADGLALDAKLMPSQMEAFRGILDFNLQLVWGPPGTGKTHFLAVSILSLAEAHRREGLPFRVLVTGFTNQAIDNCLRKIQSIQRESKIFGGSLPIRKMGTSDKAPVEVVHPLEGASFIKSNDVIVVGSTVWQARKVSPEEASYDLVVVDEGSQLEVAETAIAVRRLRSGGRLLIAGDDKQLPPIVTGNYRIPEGEPLIHRSILEALRDEGRNDAIVSTLLENFRMNDALCEYPRSSIYPNEYGPATSQIAKRRLDLKGFTPNGLISRLLDPSKPMIMHVMDGARAGAENLQEAALVAAVACKYRDLLDCSDEEFWRERLFIVSPHHAQIRAIRRELKRRREWTSEPFVDTVDKMQGQECDMVLVSYGVADPEYALMEREFIYSLNRLNVAITRARMKTIVFLSRSLLEPPLQALDRDDVAEGVAFMQGLSSHVINSRALK